MRYAVTSIASIRFFPDNEQPVWQAMWNFRTLSCVYVLALASLCRLVLPGTVNAKEPVKIPAPAKKTVLFNRDIEPLLKTRCYECHGSETQESELRLDSRANLIRGGESGEPAVVPGKSSQSYLIQLVAGTDPDRMMPPEGEKLSAKQIALLRAWIDQGAMWSDNSKDDNAKESLRLTTDFWSFQPLEKHQPPQADGNWARNPIDAFLLNRLQQENLSPSLLAHRTTLIRRLYLDMLGLPPTPEEILSFQYNTRPDAYERLVDDVLTSPHFGQRWARHWLDVVRFAETTGFETNLDRPNAWHYRDYVVDAFNADKPYNDFVFEQLAGDSVNADAATGFLVGGAYDRVKSPDIALTLMQRQDELSDMINTTGTAFLGLTLGCAKCHNHKFDPIMQKDFYAIQAVFAGVKHGDRPLLSAKTVQRMKQAETVSQQIANVDRELSELGIRDAVSFHNNIEQFEPVLTKFVRFSIVATNDGAQPCIDELEIYGSSDGEKSKKNLALADARASITASSSLSGFSIHKLEHINDGEYGNSKSWISNESGRGVITIELAEAEVIDRIVWSRDRTKKYKDRLAVNYVIDVAPDNTALSKEQWTTVATSKTRIPFGYGTSAQVGSGFAGLKPDVIERVKKLITERSSLKTKYQDLSTGIPQVYAGVFEHPEPTHRLYRGDPMAPREIVAPDVLSVLATLDLKVETPEQQRRVEFAHWIASEKNPLTARVMVNRLWHFHFGVGIVDTPSDLGRNGGRPTHPKLLDWLAGELIRSNWSLKHIHRLILTSATYQQTDAPNREKLVVDAGSRLLWRFPPRRLEAEVIRDSMLTVSAVIDSRMGGPGFSMFEPNTNYVRVYTPKEKFGPPEWRRMIYMTKVRMEQDAIFGAFDCPDAGQVAPKRTRSTTAIQALNLFNSEFTATQSTLFAERLRAEAGYNRDEQIRRAFLLVYGRNPDQVESNASLKLVEDHDLTALCRALFNSNEFLFLP